MDWRMLPLAIIIFCSVFLLLSISSLLVEPKQIEGVDYMFVKDTDVNGTGMELFGTRFKAEGTTFINNDPIQVRINKDTLARNWVIRHENCHVMQKRENREVSELECYVRMMMAWNDY